MQSLTRLLSLLLLCAATLAAPVALACDAGPAVDAAAQMAHRVAPGADADTGHLARVETTLAGMPLACIDCALCASHCIGVCTAACLPGIVDGPGGFDASTPTATVGIVIAPEPRPPRL